VQSVEIKEDDDSMFLRIFFGFLAVAGQTLVRASRKLMPSRNKQFGQ
jgi:hypothetical protein